MAGKSITDLAHDRGDDGELLPVTETVEIHGDEVDVEVHPATTGQRKEWVRRLRDHDDEAELPDDVTYELLDEFAVHDPGDFGGAASWDDVRPAITDALAGVIMARLFDAEDTDEFVTALNDAVAEALEGNAAAGQAETAEET